MKFAYGSSAVGDLKEALAHIKNPTLLVLFTTEDNFERHVAELEETFPKIPSIGCIGTSYAGTTLTESGVTVIAFSDSVKALANVIPNLSKAPVKYVKQLSDDLLAIKANQRDTVCLDFATGHDSKLLTSINSVLDPKNISLAGGTVACGKVSVNGKIYEDACAYALIKNMGYIKIYRENIYKPTLFKFTATSTDPDGYLLNELNGKPAKEVYCDALNIKESDIAKQTLKNPLGRNLTNQHYLISIKEVVGDGLACYKQTNNMDVLSIMELDDYQSVISQTIDTIKDDFPTISGILSINCILRYHLFKDLNYTNQYLETMNTCGPHAGFVSMGEHFQNQHINQTMCCIVFE